ncbi:NUDIX hydrolase YfcD [Endozoicomonas sp. Mp262]|uniref:NUDIX hydrolase YfcD n=1 Tax=Endozoicomonas sp. Mp262 TaxID=2919499 RepID=UPI0021D826FE
MSEEYVLLVDDHNQVVGTAPRGKMRQEKLCHRAVYIFVFNGKGQLLVQERTLNKDIFPGYFDITAGGVVAQGESYNQAACRELEEELGIRKVELIPHFHFYFHSDDCRVWGRVYSCCYDGSVVLQKDEVANVVLESPEDILENRFNRNYTPDSLVALERMIQTQQRGF